MIEIVAYKPQWSDEFKMFAAAIRKAVGGNAHAIHHIGSTSVPELAAKDVIDIQMTVLDLNVSIEEALRGIGFELGSHTEDHCPPGMILAPSELEKRYYRGSQRRVHLHVRKTGAFNQRYPILFRDFLRSNPMASNAYGEIKRQLARYFPEDADAYYDIKDPVCDALMAGAFEWAKLYSWTPGPSEA
jgi:GrpB-like predicted nucleotidyltransferase (UPF0157 family)